jgi:hypothetical protein
VYSITIDGHAVLSRAEGSRAPASAADRWSRFGALCGVLLGVAWAPLGLVVGDLPELDSVAEIDTFFSESGDLLKVVIACVGVGFFCLLSFLAALAQHLQDAEGGGVLKWLALTSALMFMTLFNAAVGLDAAAGLLHDTSTPEVTHALHTAAFVLAAPAALVGVAFFVAVAAAAFDIGAFPRWLGWAGVLAAIANLLALGGIFSASGPLNSGNGALGGIVAPLFAWVVWILLAAVWMLRSTAQPAPPSPASSREPGRLP